jgi:hypothetical protein
MDFPGFVSLEELLALVLEELLGNSRLRVCEDGAFRLEMAVVLEEVFLVSSETWEERIVPKHAFVFASHLQAWI